MIGDEDRWAARRMALSDGLFGRRKDTRCLGNAVNELGGSDEWNER